MGLCLDPDELGVETVSLELRKESVVIYTEGDHVEWTHSELREVLLAFAGLLR